MSDDPATRFRENATEITTMVVTGVWLALLLFPGAHGFWLPTMLFGYIVVVPLVALLYGDEADRREWWNGMWGDSTDESDEVPEPTDARDALETLRDRYAAGELTDEQFERKLDRLLETETLEDAAQRRRAGRETSARTHGSDESDRETTTRTRTSDASDSDGHDRDWSVDYDR